MRGGRAGGNPGGSPWPWALGLATLALVGAASCTAGHTLQPAGQTGAPPSTALASHAPLGAAELSPLAQRLAPYLERHFGGSYTGVLIDSPGGRLIVYRRPDPGLDAAARSLAGATPLVFVDARYSLAQQHRLIDRIRADQSYWLRHGVSVLGITAGNGVHCAALVDIAERPAAAQRAFDARYGDGAARLSKRTPTQPTSVPAPTPTGNAPH